MFENPDMTCGPMHEHVEPDNVEGASINSIIEAINRHSADQVRAAKMNCVALWMVRMKETGMPISNASVQTALDGVEAIWAATKEATGNE